MPTALRLVVMWMVGALAIAVAWCLHAQPDQPSVVSPIPPAPAPAPLSAAPVVDASRVAVMKYLRERYDSYANAPLVEINDSTLRHFFPDTRFFATKLEPGVTSGLIYWRENLLVSFRRAHCRDDIHSWPVDRNDASPQEFLAQFLGLSASTFLERCEVALGLGQLLAAVTEGGGARTSTRCFKDTHAEIRRGREPWRDVFVFSANGRVSRIAIYQKDHSLAAKVSSD
ncbi:MAG TPA: hypothetical protein VIQ54_05665 [Polyangia bacterium]